MVDESQKHHRADAVIETQSRRWRRSDDASSRSTRYSKGGAVTTWTQRNRTATRQPSPWRTIGGSGRSGATVSRWLNALQRFGWPRPQVLRLPPLIPRVIAMASPQSLDCPGVHPRLPNESAATLCSTPSPRRLEDGRRAPPDGSNRSSSRRRRAFTSSPSGGSAGFLPRAAPESFSTRGSHTKRCAGQISSRRRCPTSRPHLTRLARPGSLACRCSPHSQSGVWHASSTRLRDSADVVVAT